MSGNAIAEYRWGGTENLEIISKTFISVLGVPEFSWDL